MKISRLIQEDSNNMFKEQFARDVLTGLSSNPKFLLPKYFYNDLGSDLFQKITKHKDYYLTRTEFEILSEYSSEMSKLVKEDEIDIIELGAGDGHKSKLIVEGFLKNKAKVNFYPIDISEEAMNQLEETFDTDSNLHIHGVVAEYLEGLKFVRERSSNKQLVLFLGSNIGNFNREQSLHFLRLLWKNLSHGDFALIGFDLKKDVRTLTAAYNDSDGYTEAFNRNLLHRINDELGGEFDLNSFQHFNSYNPVIGAMESYLLSRIEQDIYIKDLKKNISFDAYEPLHVEYSFKFSKHDIEELCDQTGFQLIEQFSDDKKYFIDSLWKVTKD